MLHSTAFKEEAPYFLPPNDISQRRTVFVRLDPGCLAPDMRPAKARMC